MSPRLLGALARADGLATPPEWERPSPSARSLRNDVFGAVCVWALAVGVWWVTDQFTEAATRIPWWQAVLGLGAMAAPLAVRRRAPLGALLVASAVFLGVGVLMPSLSMQTLFQASYFAALYSAAAWAKDTRAFWICATVVLASMAVWVVLSFTLASSMEQILQHLPAQDGPVPPLAAYAFYNFVINLGFFGGALVFGRRARTGAWQRATLAEQTVQLREQSEELARRAVVDERLRIARELHDVVAHHISAVGVQAAAARTVQERDPATTARLLGQIEESSRQALTETRALLGVLRTEGGRQLGEGSDGERDAHRGQRSPEPGLGDLAALAERSGATGVSVAFTVVEDPSAPLSATPSSLGLSLYRVAQEALSNVRRHSTASSATLVLRTGTEDGAPWTEVEVVNDGRPRTGTSGGGLGQRGIRERAALHHGVAEMGPRSVGGAGSGWRVRVRLPLSRPSGGTSPSTMTSTVTSTEESLT